MNTCIAIQTGIGGNAFVTGDKDFPFNGAYRYAPDVKNAALFDSVDSAVAWIEVKSFYNGSRADRGYSGSPRLVRVEEITETRYTVVGPVE